MLTLAPLITNPEAIYKSKGLFDHNAFNERYELLTILPTPLLPPVTNTTLPDTLNRF